MFFQFISQCILEGNVEFLESFQDHKIMSYFEEQAWNHSVDATEQTVGVLFLNSDNPSKCLMDIMDGSVANSKFWIF